MTSADIRAAAQREAKRIRVTSRGNEYGMDKSYKLGFVDGAEWAAARAAPTREQLVDVLRKHQHDYCEECHMSHGCTCGWRHKDGSLSTDEYDGEDPVGSISEHQTEVLLALLAGLAEENHGRLPTDEGE